MSAAPAYVLAVVCEAPADREIATCLADRVLSREVDWIDSDSLDLHRRWQGLEHGESHLEWHWVKRLAEQRGIRPHGHFRGEPGDLNAHEARKALLLLAAANPDAVVLLRDTDGDQRRRRGLEQARDERPWPFPVILGLAHSKRECWVLAGFHPQTSAEEEALARLRQELGFDPCTTAEELYASSAGAQRDAKRVLAALIQSPDRERACWADADLESLATRGRDTGLTEYLEEVRTRLVPLFRPEGPREPPLSSDRRR